MPNEEKKEDVVDTPVAVKEPVVETKTSGKRPLRQIVIETDGNNINIVKAEVSGSIELVGIFQNLIAFVNKSRIDK